MGLFHHDQTAERQYLTHVHVEHGDGSVILSFASRDHLPHEIAVFRSVDSFAEESIEPASDPRQKLIYQGSELHSQIADEQLADGTSYFYSIFARGEDGGWHLQLKTIATAKAGVHWQWLGADRDFDREHYDLVRCERCRGTGLDPMNFADPLGCPFCHGKGWLKVEKAEAE